MVAGYAFIGLPPVVIVGGSSMVGLVCWLHTYRDGAIAPEVILPPFLLTVAALEVHMVEEYGTGFGPAMSRLFAISWTEFAFLDGLRLRRPDPLRLDRAGAFPPRAAGGVCRLVHFHRPGRGRGAPLRVPAAAPALAPHDPALLTCAFANGTVVAAMPNYWIGATGRYYFPGLFTAVLPMIPGIYGILAVLCAARVRRGA